MTNYPSSIPNLPNPLATDPMNSPSHSTQHATANDEIAAIATELGVNPSGASATVVARLDANDTAVNTKTTLTAVKADADIASVISLKHTQNSDTAFVKNDGTANPTNLLTNGDFEAWSAGTAVAPDGWTLYQATAAQGSTTPAPKLGTYYAELTGAGATPSLYQSIHTTKGIAYWKGRTITFGCWVYAVAAGAYLAISDGVGGSNSLSSHTGDSTWQWLTVTRTLDANATQVLIYCVPVNGAVSDFDGAMLVEGSSAFAFSDKPAGEGVWSDYFASSTIVGWAAGKTGTIYTKKIGKTVYCQFYITGTGDNAASTFTVPYTAVALDFHNLCYAVNAGGGAVAGRTTVGASTATVTVQPTVAGAAWTASGTRTITGQFFYEVA